MVRDMRYLISFLSCSVPSNSVNNGENRIEVYNIEAYQISNFTVVPSSNATVCVKNAAVVNGTINVWGIITMSAAMHLRLYSPDNRRIGLSRIVKLDCIMGAS